MKWFLLIVIYPKNFSYYLLYILFVILNFFVRSSFQVSMLSWCCCLSIAPFMCDALDRSLKLCDWFHVWYFSFVGMMFLNSDKNCSLTENKPKNRNHTKYLFSVKHDLFTLKVKILLFLEPTKLCILWNEHRFYFMKKDYLTILIS